MSEATRPLPPFLEAPPAPARAGWRTSAWGGEGSGDELSGQKLEL